MLDSEIVFSGEDAVIPCSDPAVTIARGYRRYLVGQDIAQAIDRNAIAIVLDERLPRWGEHGQELGPRRREVVRVEFIPQMDYTSLAQVTKTLMNDAAIKGRAYLAVDSGGPGRAYCDILNQKSVLHTRVNIVGGENETEAKERNTSFNNVGKVRLLSGLNSALHTGDLSLANFALRDELVQELESFEAEITKAGRMKIDGGTDFSHADLAIATSLAFWLSDHRSVGAMIGEVQLRGYW